MAGLLHGPVPGSHARVQARSGSQVVPAVCSRLVAARGRTRACASPASGGAAAPAKQPTSGSSGASYAPSRSGSGGASGNESGSEGPSGSPLSSSFDYDGELSRQGRPVWPRGSLTAVVLGGGETDSRRLFPLTQYRTLPPVPFGGPYRIIDLLMSNLLNSGVNKIHILTAYNSYSLNRHLQRTYDMTCGVPYGGDGYIEVVAETPSPDSQAWSNGTASCVRQFMSYFEGNTKNRFIEDVLILPGDHVYSADYTPIILSHRATGADLTVVCRPVAGDQASRLGLVKLDSAARISAFVEKPRPELLPALSMSDEEIRPFLRSSQQAEAFAAAAQQRQRPAAKGGARVGGGRGPRVVLDSQTSMDDPNPGPSFVGSTGIYIFRRQVLSDLLQSLPRARDFGRDIIPACIEQGFKVHAYRLPGYWADVGGCIGDYYTASMALLKDHPSVEFNAPISSPFFKYPLTIPASAMRGARLSRSLVSAGGIITDSRIEHSVLGPRCIIGPNVLVEDCVIMGADHYEHERPQAKPHSPSNPPIGIGEGSVLKGAIVDLNCRIGKNVTLVNKDGVFESNERAVQGIYIRDGIIVITRDAAVPDGTVL
ncbi:hypothetical protein HYH03_000146 [Edaphochlamys debaryana]|uniref:glucose-1-phosphate adenylyltransferase n=1 Tax=Edaphochlamys debaryana TaxID=47281 RepID=A0A836C7C8_9CHLO|nr:hypothetical protein HYH03_000146 [Edaphochlamys debaryana]|eukprot:KAG2501642.1 hypothetical protein HYH03_000146 [Edaphochlamys debaryana]